MSEHRVVRFMISLVSACALSLALVPCAAFAQNAEQTNSTADAATSASTDDLVEDELIVTYKAKKDIDDVVEDADVDSEDTEVLATDIDSSDIAKVTLADEQGADAAIEQLESDPRVESVEYNMRYHLLKSVNDPYASSTSTDSIALGAYSYYLESEKVEDAWNTATCEDSDVTVAVLDTGISMDEDYRVDDLDNTVDYSNAYDATSASALSSSYIDAYYDSEYDETLCHGTWVASCIAAEANNGIGTAGTSYNATVLPINVFAKSSYYGLYSDTSYLITAYNYILNNADSLNIKVVNMSLGGDTVERKDTSLQTLITEAFNDGILTVAAAGNEGDGYYEYPASFDNVISVGAVNSSGTVTSWSQHNDAVDIAAAGEGIVVPEAVTASINGPSRLSHFTNSTVSYQASNDYITESGTSFACPIASGIAALLYAADPKMNAKAATLLLENTATDRGKKGKDNYYGYGEVNAAAAVEEAAATTATKYVKAIAFEDSKVKLKSVKAAKRKITVKWKRLKYASGYRILYKKKAAKTWKYRTVKSANKLKKVIKNLKRKKRYRIRVRAYNTTLRASKIWSKYSAIKTVKIK